MPSFLPEGVRYSARGDVSLFYVFLPLSPVGLELREQTVLCPPAQLLFRGGRRIPAPRGMLQRTWGCRPAPPRSSGAVGWRLHSQLEVPLLAWFACGSPKFHCLDTSQPFARG